MKLKILTDDLTEIDVNWYSFWARTMLSKRKKEFLPELTALAELGHHGAIITWYNIFNVGENINIDKLVEDYPDMTDLEALRQLEEAVHDLTYRSHIVSVEECKRKIEESNLALVKFSQKLPKISKIKDIKNSLLIRFGFGIKVQEEEEKLNSMLAVGSAQLTDLVKSLGKILKTKTELKPEHLMMLKRIADIECCVQVEQKLKENTKNLL